ncbi:HAMP domain-containing sensor histidine kinase [Lysinibacillus sp. 54212]|uniref:HAMP domain-containing sensor histidine kinase n=1 Tax=Lysinibacillus sp. 54212 TaxID=3119829 RepID=UPI002FCAE8EB
MFIKNKRVSLLSYWTSRYVLTLLVGLGILFVISAVWIRHTTFEHRIEMMEVIVDETVYRLTNSEQNNGPSKIEGYLEERDKNPELFRQMNPVIYVTNADGGILTKNRPFTSMVDIDFSKIITNDSLVQRVHLDGEPFFVIKRAIELNDGIVGYVFAVESKRVLTEVNQEFGLLAVVIFIIGLLGWGAIYFLSKRLTKPIMDVAKAAMQVKEGHYNIILPDNLKEREMYELVTSFKEMTAKLEQLEKTRTELLAGVTHELKTPVTSISGLLQAVQDGVVTGEDAHEFIAMAVAETTKMKKMVGDLLAFNSFAVSAVPVNIETYGVNDIINDVAIRWKATHTQVEVTVNPLAIDCCVHVDLVRVQQIITNLLTNAEQAMANDGQIYLSISEHDDFVSVAIQDNGCGITIEEQPFIFERFYRGDNKKYKVRGLGLGLALSKMMAKSICGELSLEWSNENGTCFKLLLEKSN